MFFCQIIFYKQQEHGHMRWQLTFEQSTIDRVGIKRIENNRMFFLNSYSKHISYFSFHVIGQFYNNKWCDEIAISFI